MRRCPRDRGGPQHAAVGSVWSSERGAWVDATVTTDSGICAQLERDVTEARGVVEDALGQAGSEARRGGVAGSDIRDVAAVLNLPLP